MSNLARFGTFTEAAATADKEAVDASRPRAPFWTPAEGENIFRMFPPLPGYDTPWVTCWQHFLKLPWLEKKEQTGANCPRVMLKQSCPICALAQQLASSSDAGHRKLAESIAPNFRAFAVIIDRNDVEKGPQIWGFSKGLYDKMILLRKNARAGGDFVDPEKGCDLVLTRTGKELDTRYELLPDRGASALGSDEEIDFWLESFPDFRNKADCLPDEEIKDLLGKVPVIKTTVNAASASVDTRGTPPALPAAAVRASAAAGGRARFASTDAPSRGSARSTVQPSSRADEDLDAVEPGDFDPDLD